MNKKIPKNVLLQPCLCLHKKYHFICPSRRRTWKSITTDVVGCSLLTFSVLFCHAFKVCRVRCSLVASVMSADDVDDDDMNDHVTESHLSRHQNRTFKINNIFRAHEHWTHITSHHRHIFNGLVVKHGTLEFNNNEKWLKDFYRGSRTLFHRLIL